MNARHTCRVIVQCGLLPHQVLEEGLGGEVRVVLLGQRALHVDDLEAAQLEAALLEAGNDLADESALRGLARGWRGTKDMLESECSADGREGDAVSVGRRRRMGIPFHRTWTPSGLIMM